MFDSSCFSCPLAYVSKCITHSPASQQFNNRSKTAVSPLLGKTKQASHGYHTTVTDNLPLMNWQCPQPSAAAPQLCHRPQTILYDSETILQPSVHTKVLYWSVKGHSIFKHNKYHWASIDFVFSDCCLNVFWLLVPIKFAGKEQVNGEKRRFFSANFQEKTNARQV